MAKRIFGSALLFLLIGSVLGFPCVDNLNPGVASAASLDEDSSVFDSTTPSQGDATANVTAASFRFPLDGGWSVTLGFGDTTDSGTHLGEDVFRPGGTEVYASADGTVRFAGSASGYGAAVVEEHYTGSEYVCTFYGHLSSRFELQVSSGQEVSEGQLIGYIAYDDEDGGDWSPHLHFGVYKGPYQTGWVYYDYEPPGNVADWYDPSDFIETYEAKPQDRSLVSPSDGSYQDGVYWLQNGKLYWVTEYIDDDSDLGSTIEGMSSLPRWGEGKISEFPSGLLASYSGWPDGVARFVTAGAESNGLLIREAGASYVYLIQNGERIWFPDPAAVEYAGYSLADVIDVTDEIIDLFSGVSDSAELVDKSGDIVVTPGQTFSIWLGVKNTGSSTWVEKLQYRLGWRSGFELFPNSESCNRVTLGSSDNITPGMTQYWSVCGITAPNSPGTYTMVWQMVRENVYWFGDTACIRVVIGEPSNPPYTPVTLSGPRYGYVGTSYSYSTSATDPDGDEVKYTFDWGDGTTSETDYVNSDTLASISHGWDEAGTYDVRVKATDRGGASSDWSGSKTVTIESLPESAPSAPALSSPEDGAAVSGTEVLVAGEVTQRCSVTFEWEALAGADKYFLEVNTSSTWDNTSSTWDEEERKVYEAIDNTAKTVTDFALEYRDTKRGFDNDGTTYYWRVKARNTSGWGAWSEGRSFINIGEPLAPTLSSPEGGDVVSGTSVTFIWEASDGASKYHLEVNTDPNFGNDTMMFYGDVGDVTEYTDIAYLNNDTRYYWRVRAGNDAGWGTPSSSWSFISAAPTLSSPDKGASVSGASVTFEWEALSEADKYLLEVNTDPELLEVSIDPKWDSEIPEWFEEEEKRFYGDVGNVIEYEDTGYPNDGTRYYWRVWASIDGEWKFRSEIWTFINTSVEKPSAPTLTSPKESEEEDIATPQISGTSVTFIWEASERADNYQLEVNSSSSWGKGTRKFLGSVGDVTEYEDTGYPNDSTTYYWRVRAGNATGWSSWSESASFINPSRPAPILVSPLKEEEDGTKTQVAGTSITFTWQASPRATKYQLEVNAEPALEDWEENTDPWGKATRKYRGVVDGLSKAVTGFPNDGTTYYWRVRASSDDGWSNWSETWSFSNGDFDSFDEESVPILSSPADGARISGTSITFDWTALEGACSYQLEVNSSRFWDKETRKWRRTVNNALTEVVTGFPDDGTMYYWRVRARNAAGWSDWSESWSFVNGPP